MGLLNNLRKCIVDKLIRPEDGYTFTGFSDDKPVKLCYQEGTNKYLFQKTHAGKRVYYEPTLSGWKEYPCDNQPGEVYFQLWICGVLGNISTQYSKRLDEITTMIRGPRRLNDFKKNANGDKLMINKQSFCEIMNALDKYWDNLRGLEEILDVVFEGNFLTAIYDAVVDALEDDLEPELDDGEEPMLYRWLLEFDAGRSNKAKEGIDGHPLTTAAELYDYLTWKRDVSSDDED